jgi:hypothetical protein
MAFQSKKDGAGGPLKKLAVEDATTLLTPPNMAQPLADPSTQAMARQVDQRSKQNLKAVDKIVLIVMEPL